MILDVTAIWEDDLPRASDTPDGTAFALRVPKGASITVRVTVIDPAGIPVDLAGYTAVMTVKRGIMLEDIVAHKPGVIPLPTSDGVMTFTFTPADLDTDPGRCAYDVWLTSDSDERQQVVALSPFLLGFAAGP